MREKRLEDVFWQSQSLVKNTIHVKNGISDEFLNEN